MAENRLIIIPFGDIILALDAEQFELAVQRGREFEVKHNGKPNQGHEPEQIVDAEGAYKATGIPASWFLEAARQSKIPYIRAGKYVRFKLGDIMRALEVRQR